MLASATGLDERRGGPTKRPKRPASVTLVAVLALGVAVYSLVYGVLAVRSGDHDRLADGIFHLALGVGALAAAGGAFRLQGWAWAAFMTWAVIGLTHQILRSLFLGDPGYADMAVNTFAVLALSPLEVQIAFGLRHTENVQLARPTRNPLDRH
jgi:FtsH-binding integral membrane protein